MELCESSSCVRGYHIYKDIWDVVIGEELQCERELIQTEAIGIQSPLKDGIITSHLLCKYHQPVPFPKK